MKHHIVPAWCVIMYTRPNPQHTPAGSCTMNPARFEWTPEFWQGWRESADPYRRYKSARDRQMAVQTLEPQDRDRILEIGCGYGWISEELWASARIDWVGVDRSDEMVQRLRASHPEHAEAAFSADACRLPFADAKFDKVLCTGVLMHISSYATAIRELVRVLRPGGVLLCSFNNALSPWSLPVRLWNRHKPGFLQKFVFPASFCGLLRNAGLRLESRAGDGIIATVPIALGPLHFPPERFHSSICRLDQWAAQRLPYFSYEIWVRGLKPSLCVS